MNGKAVSGDDRGLNEAVSLIAKSEGRDVDLQLRRKVREAYPEVEAMWY